MMRLHLAIATLAITLNFAMSTDDEAMQDFVEAQADTGALTKWESDELLRKVYNSDAALQRCYRFNKGKGNAKLLQRMKLLLPAKPEETHARTSGSQQAPTPPASPSEPKENGPVFNVYLKRMHDVYEKHAPSKKASVQGFLERSNGEEHDLYLKVCKKYGESPKAKYHTPDATKGSSSPSTGGKSLHDMNTEEGLLGVMAKLAKLPPAERTQSISKLADEMAKTKGIESQMGELKQFEQIVQMKKQMPGQWSNMMQQMEPPHQVMVELLETMLDRNPALFSGGAVSPNSVSGNPSAGVPETFAEMQKRQEIQARLKGAEAKAQTKDIPKHDVL